MTKPITFDEYLATGYQEVLERVREHFRNYECRHGKNLDEMMQERKMPFNEFVANLEAVLELCKRDNPISKNDLPRYARKRVRGEGRMRPLDKGQKYINLEVTECGFIPLISDAGNYGLELIGPPVEADFWHILDEDLESNEEIRQKYDRDDKLQTIRFGFERGPQNLVFRKSHRKFDRSAPIWKETEGLDWRQITPEQNIEMEYQEHINPSGTFRLTRVEDYPLNRVMITHAGNSRGAVEFVLFFAKYAREKGYMTHFDTLKMPWFGPDVLFDPRKDRK